MENIVQLAPVITALAALFGTLIQQHYAAEKRLREEREQNEKNQNHLLYDYKQQYSPFPQKP